MRLEKAAAIIMAMGVDPSTGQELAADNALSRPEVIRALVLAGDVLRRRAEKADENRPMRAGSSWTDLEDQELSDMFERRTPLNQIAADLGKTKSAIAARLVRVGLVQDREVARKLLSSSSD